MSQRSVENDHNGASYEGSEEQDLRVEHLDSVASLKQLQLDADEESQDALDASDLQEVGVAESETQSLSERLDGVGAHGIGVGARSPQEGVEKESESEHDHSLGNGVVFEVELEFAPFSKRAQSSENVGLGSYGDVDGEVEHSADLESAVGVEPNSGDSLREDGVEGPSEGHQNSAEKHKTRGLERVLVEEVGEGGEQGSQDDDVFQRLSLHEPVNHKGEDNTGKVGYSFPRLVHLIWVVREESLQ